MRLVIISNRLPVTVSEKNGRLIIKESVGGLATGLKSYIDFIKNSTQENIEYIWIGWPGTFDFKNEKKAEELTEKLMGELHCYPVYIDKDIIDKFYFGFCNKTIWPLFHYFAEYTIYDDEYWEAYEKVNEIFYNTSMKIIKDDDIIWVHDYHLMLLPGMLSKSLYNPIGFFLHIPFPDYEIFRLLPRKWAINILYGLLGSNVIGFHTYSYTQYFIRCVLYMLGISNDMNKIILESNVARADTFPMGIDFKKFNSANTLKEVKKAIKVYSKKLSAVKVILSVDRLDYTKGILNRLFAFEKFLNKYPQWHNKVVLLLIVVPSRTGVEHYDKIKRDIDQMVGKINGQFGNVSWTPIVYQYRFEPFHRLAALYIISDIALITPLRDGMNLIAKEYIASREDKTGVLILSEMAGASSELGETIIVNPNDINDIVNALVAALEISKEEQIQRNTIMQRRLERYNIIKWADSFLHEVKAVKEDQLKLNARLINKVIEDKILNDMKVAKNRIICLDYDGTLVPLEKRPDLAKPDKDILNLLEMLSRNTKNTIAVVSGRDKNTLDQWFGFLGITLIAEHGVWIKGKGENWEINIMPTNEWKGEIKKILEIYTDRLPGSFIEEKEYSLVWHYRRSDPEMSSLLIKELTDYLLSFTANMNLQVMQGNKVIEIKNAGIDKGSAVLKLLTNIDYDFILAIGDDWTDEYLFKVLPESAYTLRVGMIQSYARYNILNYSEVRKLLTTLAEV